MARKAKRTVTVLKAALTQESLVLDEDESARPLTAKCIDIDPARVSIGLSGGLANINITKASTLIDQESIMFEHLAVHRRSAYRGNMWNLESTYNDNNMSAINVTFEVKEGKTKKKYVAQRKKVIRILESSEILKLGFSKDLDINNLKSIAVSRKTKLKNRNVDFLTFTVDINQEVQSITMPEFCTTKDDTIKVLTKTIKDCFSENENLTKRLIDLDHAHYARIKEKKPMGTNPINKEEIYNSILNDLNSDIIKIVSNITLGIRQKCFTTTTTIDAKAREIYNAIETNSAATVIDLSITGPIILKESYSSKCIPITAVVEVTREISISALKTSLDDIAQLNQNSRTRLGVAKCKEWFKGITLSGARRQYTLETPGNVVDALITNHQENANAYTPTTRIEVNINVR